MMTQDQGRASLEKFSPKIEKLCSQKVANRPRQEDLRRDGDKRRNGR